MTMSNFEKVKGKTILGVVLLTTDGEMQELYFFCDDGTIMRQYHDRDCCEEVNIEEVCGDWGDLIGSQILHATETSSSKINNDKYSDDSETWTFYSLSTIKGTVNIRWYGTSNGYYSEEVFCEWTSFEDEKRKLLKYGDQYIGREFKVYAGEIPPEWALFFGEERMTP